ncbi:hypothetical protein [Nocardioides convexus]|uniref:hypothetical protein n=1 Tax=Nocardioides convexus TaxID=2712224 RepID=UPI002418399B|nr:hypothetical protein [Nocardioides convexus]
MADPTSGDQHHRLPPAAAARSSGPVHGEQRQHFAAARDWLPLGLAGASSHLQDRRPPDRPSLEDTSAPSLRINERIRVPEVRLVGPNGETVGIVPTDQALKARAGGRPGPGGDRPDGEAPCLQGSWTTGSSSTRTPRRPVRRDGTRPTSSSRR